ncbi:hypothetical protein HOLleu_15309 [Holothuria leucospilota]|uniref:Uncharacterized protein n=1 Tax=Holothuria leucospilota TaxID=206669 RepID=A0A9Q1HD70_HOLLE|nr:hypothetical protein HOLleu_15309 [Holothuria leucospilota]
MWWHGPMFLREEKYTISEIDPSEITNDDVEIKKAKDLASHVTMQLIPELLKNKVRRIIARCLIFISMLKGTPKTREMTVDDLTKAERFVCRRGAVNQLRGSNSIGSNSIGARGELQEALAEMSHDTLHDELLKFSCDWIFNATIASHQGGVWERMIPTTRGILNSLLFQHNQLSNDETLTTFMAEAETIINSRPLAASNKTSEEPLIPPVSLH